MNVVFVCDVVCHGGRFGPWMDGKGKLVMVDGEDLLSLKVKDYLFKVFRCGVDIFPISVVLPIL